MGVKYAAPCKLKKKVFYEVALTSQRHQEIKTCRNNNLLENCVYIHWFIEIIK